MRFETEGLSRRTSWRFAAAAVKLRFERFSRSFDRKYDSNQPRVPAGQPRGGQWTNGSGETTRSNYFSGSNVDSILALAPRLVASGVNKNRCIALCAPLLEAAQPRNTTNMNYWNFTRCLNACLGK